MPQSVSKQCTVFVDTYTDMIIDMLTKVGWTWARLPELDKFRYYRAVASSPQDVTPEMICTNLGLCDNNLAKTIRMVVSYIIILHSDTVEAFGNWDTNFAGCYFKR